jgi:hypothetical protein
MMQYRHPSLVPQCPRRLRPGTQGFHLDVCLIIRTAAVPLRRARGSSEESAPELTANALEVSRKCMQGGQKSPAGVLPHPSSGERSPLGCRGSPWVKFRICKGIHVSKQPGRPRRGSARKDLIRIVEEFISEAAAVRVLHLERRFWRSRKGHDLAEVVTDREPTAPLPLRNNCAELELAMQHTRQRKATLASLDSAQLFPCACELTCLNEGPTLHEVKGAP